jgi:hypothetical protein
MADEGRVAGIPRLHVSEARRDAWALVCIIGVYLCLGVAYALRTPPWQAPDEPAHYNYVVHLAEQGTLPVLSQGDYPAQYLEVIKAQRFPASMSIELLRYESHQPPLYYLWSSVVYRLAAPLGLDGSLIALRLWSVFLGALGLVACYRAVRAYAPEDWTLAVGTTAFAATLPMHVAMTASVNNDVLAELLVVLVAWQLLSTDGQAWDVRRSLSLGVVLGLAVLTKMQTYPALAMTGVAIAWDHLGPGRQRRWAALAGNLARVFGVALAMAAPWVWRNTRIYGAADPLGLVRHDQVVLGQLTSAELIARVGWPAYLRQFASTTFHSFWGQFGWMAAPLDDRVYTLLAIVSALAGVGAVSVAWRAVRHWRYLSLRRKRGILLMATWLCVTAAGYLWYNTKYVQFQGRYLFPAIVPLGVLFTAGLREVLLKPLWLPVGLLVVALAALALYDLRVGELYRFELAALAGALPALLAGRWLQKRSVVVALCVMYGGMALLAVYALARVVVPSLTP